MSDTKIVMLSINDVKPYEKNPRRNDEAVKYVANSIKEFGWKQPIVVDRNNVIVAGHTRWKAAQQLGLKDVPCVIADDLTDEQVKAFRLADNKVGEIAKWDDALLNEELMDIDLDIDMSDFGFVEVSDIDIDKFFEDVEFQAEKKEKEITCPHCGMTFKA